MKLEDFLMAYTKINLNLIKDLNVKLHSLKFLEEKIGIIFSDINHRKFFYPLLRVMKIKEK